MKIKKWKRIGYIISGVLCLSTLLPAATAHAAQLTSRKLTLSSSAPSAASTSYTFNFTVPTTGTTIQSINIDLCTTASGTCDPTTSTGTPNGTTTSATLGSVSGIGSASGWTGTFTTNNRLRIANASNSGTPGAAQLVFNSITNPSTTNTTFYARITTYSAAAFTGPIDTGTVAASTASQITVSGTVDETLTFCSATSGITSSSCAGATGSTVNLGSLTSSTTGASTSQLGIATNAGGGYNITVSGTTLTSGSNTIAALATQTASTQGTPQFGMNLRANTTPSVGSDPAGSGTATPNTNYNTANQFRFVTGDTIASASAADNFRQFTVSYIANVSSTTVAGTYSTNLTYTATTTF